MEAIRLFGNYLDDYFGIIATVFMVKYFSCHEIDIDRRLWISCGIYEFIVIMLDKFNIISDGLIQDLIVIVAVLLYTYKLQAYKKVVSIIASFCICMMLGSILFLSVSIFSEPLFWSDNAGYDNTINKNVITFISIIADIIIIIFINKKIKENLYILISKLDIFIMSIITVVSFILIFVIDAFKGITIYDEFSDRWIIALIAVCGIIMNIAILISMFKSKSAYYYKNMSEINEHYMEMQLKHFEAYKNSQTETRRIKHDMKNHIICITDLLEKNKIDELKEYIKTLKESIESIDSNFKTGNIVVDSIINEKYAVMKKQDIDFHIDGYINEESNMQPVDICTIFANAIDNAIEGALKDKDKSKRKIDINIKENKNFMFITFVNNMVMVKRNEKNKFITTKHDKINHGFGILNIKYALDKYHGDLDIETEDDKFKLQIVLPK